MDQSHGWSRESFHGRHGLPWGLVTPATPRFSNCFSLSGWRYYSSLWHFLGFPSGSAGKESACNVGHLDSIPGLGRSLGERKGYPLQYSGLENSMDCIVHGVAKSWTRQSDFHFTSPRDLPDVGFEPGSPILQDRLTRPFRTNTPKRCPFHYRGLECKSRKSRNTWSNRQIWSWNTEWSRAKTNRVLPRKCTGHSKHSLPTTQEKTLYMDITRWSTPKSEWLLIIDYSLQPKMEKLYTVSKNKTRSWLWLRPWTPYCQICTLFANKYSSINFQD